MGPVGGDMAEEGGEVTSRAVHRQRNRYVRDLRRNGIVTDGDFPRLYRGHEWGLLTAEP